MEATLVSFYDDLVDRCSQRVGAPVQAAGAFNLAGGMGRMAVHKASPVLGWALRKKAEQHAGLPKRTMLAVTPDSVVVFATTLKKRREELADVVATWPRRDVRVVAVDEVSLFTRVTLDVAGHRFALDGAKDERAHELIQLLQQV